MRYGFRNGVVTGDRQVGVCWPALFGSMRQKSAFLAGLLLTLYSACKTIAGLLFGGVPERSKGSDCKSDGSAFGGSNPPPSTIKPVLSVIGGKGMGDGGSRYRRWRFREARQAGGCEGRSATGKIGDPCKSLSCATPARGRGLSGGCFRRQGVARRV